VKSWNGLLYNTATYAINDGLKLQVDVNALSYAARLTDISSVPWQESQVRFEVIKLLRRSPWKASRTLRLRLFEDENGNQHKDPPEPYMVGLVVNVGSTPMITDNKGVILHKDMAPGLYSIRAIFRVTTGEPVWFMDTVRLAKSVQLDMPIRKTWWVVGQLRCNKAKYDEQACELDQYKVEMRRTGRGEKPSVPIPTRPAISTYTFPLDSTRFRLHRCSRSPCAKRRITRYRQVENQTRCE
jgi:hypothetical protein